MKTLKRVTVALQSFHPLPCAPAWVSKSPVLLFTVVLATALLVLGCSDSGNDQPPTQDPPAQSLTSAGGVWNGAWTDDLSGESFAVSGVVREDNVQGRFVTDSGPGFLLSDISGTDGELSATITASTAGLDETFQDGSYHTSGALTGFVVERARIDGTWSLDSGETGTLTLDYDDIYERGSDIARLVGTWECPIGTICNIDALGDIFGQGEEYCVATGQIEIIDPSYNVYQVTYGSPCTIFGSLRGLGVLADESGTNDAFVIMLDSGFSFFGTIVFVRQ